MVHVLYDDNSFPTGTAGGKMRQLYPEHTTRYLDMAAEDVTGPMHYQTTIPNGTFMGCVAMQNTDPSNRIDITSEVTDRTLNWPVPAGNWKVMCFSCADQGGDAVNYLSAEGTARLIELTYEQYWTHFADYFGSTIKMGYYDDIGFVKSTGYQQWIDNYNEQFILKNEYNPLIYYPALWYDIGEDTEAARAALFGFRSHLMANAYPRIIAEWCTAHGILSSGHAQGAYRTTPVDLGGDAMKFYKYATAPMVDAINYHGHGRDGFRIVSSASFNWDKELTVIEIYGNFSEEMNETMLYKAAMEAYAQGINYILPHGTWVDYNNVAIRSDISWRNPVNAAALPDYNNWAARCRRVLEAGRHVVDIAVLYPIKALEAYYHFDNDAPSGPYGHYGNYFPPETDYLEIGKHLTSTLRHDFTFLHPEVLDELSSVTQDGVDPVIRLNNEKNWEQYKILIIPGGKVIAWSNLQQIKEFFDKGGMVIGTSQLPFKSAEFGKDSIVQETVLQMFAVDPQSPGDIVEFSENTGANGGKAYFIPSPSADNLQTVLDKYQGIYDVAFETNPVVTSGNGELTYIHKVKEGAHYYYSQNSSDDPVDTWVSLKGSFDPELLDPHTGAFSIPEFSKTANTTRVRLVLDPVKSVFIRSTGILDVKKGKKEESALMKNTFTFTVTGAIHKIPVNPKKISIYTLSGEKVIEIMPGKNRARWDGRSAAGNRVQSGLYIARFHTPDGPVIRTLLLK
jgi:hypothetical protein